MAWRDYIFNMKYLVGVALFSVILLLGGIYWYFFFGKPHFDELTLRAFEQARLIETYRHAVETDIDIAGRHLHIAGVYALDHKKGHFSSISTTTLTIPDMPAGNREHSFTLENIAVEHDVFTRIQTSSSHFKKTIPHGKEWLHFTPGNIPEEFQNIAVHGPILDNLGLFRDGEHLLLPAGAPRADTRDGKALQQYTFTLQSGAANKVSGALAAVIEHIGAGTVNAWIDPESAQLYALAFHNATYQSKTIIIATSTAITIEPPVDFAISQPFQQ